MPRIAYEDWNPGDAALDVIDQCNAICADYARQGYDLTLRQLYYQFVARDLLPNTQQSYKRLGDIVNKARLAGFLDWNYIVDRTRNLRALSHWDSPSDIIAGAAEGYHRDLWDDQPTRVEVWVEKEALAGVIQKAADRFDCAWFSCRGYVSQSELWTAGRRLRRYVDAGQDVVVLHLGDHDPSGIDMTRDITDRLEMFTGAVGCEIVVRRIALTMDQVEQYNPPPNPAKLTDSRVDGYLRLYGSQSWELDALDPATLERLIASHIEGIVDIDMYRQAEEVMDSERELLELASADWEGVVDYLEGGTE